MSTYTSPVTVAELQAYLRDGSTDTAILAFYARLLDVATESVYTWLGRDYTASAAKTDRFFGDGTLFYSPLYPVGALVSWSYIDATGTVVTLDVSDLIIRAKGYLVQSKAGAFVRGAEHTLEYTQPSTIECPETVAQVITEVAAALFDESNQGSGTLGVLYASSNDGSGLERQRFVDLSARHQEMLAPYKRYVV